MLPLPLLLFIAYRSYNALRALSFPGSSSPNAWDLLFIALGNPYNIYLAIGLLYLYLVCDLLPEPELGQLVLLRLGSRRRWWLGKMTTLFVATLTYVLGIAGLLAGLSSLVLPWQTGYSTWAANSPEGVNLPMNFFRQIDPGSPLLTLGQELLLIGLGLFSIGLIMMVVTQLTQRYFIGLVAGVVILFGSFIGLGLSGPPPWVVILPSAHLTYTAFIPIRTFPVLYSALYWCAWIGLLAFAGNHISLKQDHLAGIDQA